MEKYYNFRQKQDNTFHSPLSLLTWLVGRGGDTTCRLDYGPPDPMTWPRRPGATWPPWPCGQKSMIENIIFCHAWLVNIPLDIHNIPCWKMTYLPSHWTAFELINPSHILERTILIPKCSKYDYLTVRMYLLLLNLFTEVSHQILKCLKQPNHLIHCVNFSGLGFFSHQIDNRCQNDNLSM